MAKNRKMFGSKKFVATLPLLVAPSDEQINQMEIEFHQNQDLGKMDLTENRYFIWLMELEDYQFELMHSYPYYGDDCWDMHLPDPFDEDPRGDYIFDDYTGPDADGLVDWAEDIFDISAFPWDAHEEQFMRSIRLFGLKYTERTQVIRDYSF